MSCKSEPDFYRAGFDIENKKIKLKEIESEISDSDIWKDRQKAEEKIKEFGEIKEIVDEFNKIQKNLDELENSFTEEKFYETKKLLNKLELKTLFVGKYDKQSAILSISAGAGGQVKGKAPCDAVQGGAAPALPPHVGGTPRRQRGSVHINGPRAAGS